MKSNSLRVFAVVLALGLAGCFGPGSPEEQLSSIEEKLTKNLPMTDEQKSSVAAHVAKGREALESGNKEAASAAFGEALAILKLAEDIALYNKSE